MKQALIDFIDTIDGLMIIFVVIFATIKIILDPKSRAFKKAMASYFIGVPVGILAAMIAQELSLQNATAIGIGCICCLLSEKLILFIMDFNFQPILKKWIGDKFK